MHLVPVQLDLFPHALLADHPFVTDKERDSRSRSQWLRSILSYLNFQTGDAWRRLSDPEQRWSADRIWYLYGIQTINAVMGGRNPKWDPFIQKKQPQPLRRPMPRRRREDRVA